MYVEADSMHKDGAYRFVIINFSNPQYPSVCKFRALWQICRNSACRTISYV